MKFRLAFFILVIEAIFVFGHWAVYKTLIYFGGDLFNSHTLGLKIFLGIMAFTFVSASLFSQFWYNPLTSWFYKISAVWLGTLHFIMLATIVLWLSYSVAISYSLPFNSNLALFVLYGLAIMISVFGVVNSFQLRITRLNLALPNLPINWKGKQIVFVADTHFGQVRGTASSKKVAKKIQSLNPEVLLIGGDFYDGPETDFAGQANAFSEIKTKYGIYFVSGNHETYTTGNKYSQALSNSKIQNINDKVVNLDGLQLIGVSYEKSYDAEQIEKILTTIKFDNKKASIVLKHVPQFIPTVTKFGASLQLYGHTHKGQMFPGNLLTQKVFKGYNYGLHKNGSSLIYTTSGVGTWGPPQRVGSISEIVFITLI